MDGRDRVRRGTAATRDEPDELRRPGALLSDRVDRHGAAAAATGTDTLGEGAILGLVVGVSYALVVTATDAVFDPDKPKPWTWFAISGAYHVVSLVLVGMILGAWQNRLTVRVTRVRVASGLSFARLPATRHEYRIDGPSAAVSA